MKNAEVFLDGDLLLTNDKVVSVIRYGNQGQDQGGILKSNGANVIIGNNKDCSWDQAVKGGSQFMMFARTCAKTWENGRNSRLAKAEDALYKILGRK